jgi:four helix bundle protein
MTPEELKRRTRRFALAVIKFAERLPKTRSGDVIGRQLIRCGTSVGANYRAACRARSSAEFVAKLGIVEEEADESAYWIELLVEGQLVPAEDANPLLVEANAIVAIVVSSIRTARDRPAKSV